MVYIKKCSNYKNIILDTLEFSVLLRLNLQYHISYQRPESLSKTQTIIQDSNHYPRLKPH